MKSKETVSYRNKIFWRAAFSGLLSMLMAQTVSAEVLCQNSHKQALIYNGSASSVMKSRNFKNATHFTTLYSLVQILKSGALLPPEKQALRGDSERFTGMVFTFITSLDQMPEAENISRYSFAQGVRYDAKGDYIIDKNGNREWDGDLQKILLIFDTSLFDSQQNFRISSKGMVYGTLNEQEDYQSFQGPAKLAEFLDNKKPGEVVSSEIPLKFLKEIWVHPVMRDQFIEHLHQQGVTSVDGRRVEDIIKSPIAKGRFEREVTNPEAPPERRLYRWHLVPN